MAKNFRASGAVVLNNDHVLVVHRPRYDDWSLPKGKVEKAEPDAVTAVREIYEETGYRIRVSLPLSPVRYQVKNRTKLVTWWLGHLVDERQNEKHDNETDQIVWLPIGQAIRQLTYQTDISVLIEALRAPALKPLLVVRHAQATKRKQWDGSDLERPLAARGFEQAQQLMKVFNAFGVSALASSPAERCVATIRPYAQDNQIQIQQIDEITEASGKKDEASAQHAFRKLASQAVDRPEIMAICVHRPLQPALTKAMKVDADHTLEPAEILVLGLNENHRAKELDYIPPET